MNARDSAKTEREPRRPDAGRRRFRQGLPAGGFGTALAAAGFSAFGHGGSPQEMLERAPFTGDRPLARLGAGGARTGEPRAIVARAVEAVARPPRRGCEHAVRKRRAGATKTHAATAASRRPAGNSAPAARSDGTPTWRKR